MEEKRPSFVEASDSDIKKTGLKCCVRNYEEVIKIRTRKLKSAKFFRALQEFMSHHNLSSFGLITMEIKLSRSNINSLSTISRIRLQINTGFLRVVQVYDMKINGRVINI